MEAYRTDEADATVNVVQINGGGYNPSKHSLEGNTDIQYMEAIAYPTPLTYYSTGGTPNSLIDDPYIRWLRYLLAKKSVPQTISVSYGGYEQDMPLDNMVSVHPIRSAWCARRQRPLRDR